MSSTEITVIDDENSISIDDDFSTTTYDFYPENKKYKISFSIKDDCFYAHSTYEYKISVNPVEVSIRLLEKSYEPPLRFEVRDNVVLESEIKKEAITPKDTISELKKEVEWNRLELHGYVILFYILSIHPEIVPIDEFRKYLRQIEERLKSGLLKIESTLKEKDATGLQIMEHDEEKQIWYQDDKDFSEEELDKRIKYTRKLTDSLFDNKSPNYCGLAEYEFRVSTRFLKKIEELLNKKPSIKKTVQSAVVGSSNNSNKWAIVIVLSFIALYWGLWTAIGIFILGAIIISLISKK